jgi:hypothetical protein
MTKKSSPQALAKTLTLFSYDWDAVEFAKARGQWPQITAGFDLFSFPSNARLAWFDMQRFCTLASLKARAFGARAVVSNHEQFGALCAAIIAEKNGWPGTSVEAVLACQHKLYARQVLQRVAPEANIPFSRLDAVYGGDVPEGLVYPLFVKPVKAAFSVLAKRINSHRELYQHTRFEPWELWVIRHLVEPFERILKERLPTAPSAHSLMIEEPLHGPQFCLDGYFFDGEYRHLGVVDAVMYPGTDAFMRFDYPSCLSMDLQQQARQVAQRFLQAVGFRHGLFNMEFIVDQASGQVKVVEFNPRMASQFSDLYARVDGLNLHAMQLAMSHGIDPQSLPRQAPQAKHVSSFVYRSFDRGFVPTKPGAAQLGAFRSAFPDALLFQYPKLAGQIERDFKWLDSYRYGIMHLGGQDPDDLRQRCERASQLLGWPAPYADNRPSIPGLGDVIAGWDSDPLGENATG